MLRIGLTACVLSALAGNLSAKKVIRHRSRTPRRLNNFVTQLFNAEALTGDSTHVFTIENPRNGWLFFRCRALVGRAGAVEASVRLRTAQNAPPQPVLAYKAGERRTIESMRYLTKGSYTVRLKMTDAEVATFEARLIPMIIYQRVPGDFRAMQGFAPYDRRFLKRCGMLDSVNTIGTYDGFPWLNDWRRQGKRAIRISGGIGALNTEEKAFNHWNGSMGNPGGVSGMIVDEFYPSLKSRFPLWVQALKRVRERHPSGLCLLYTAGGADTLRELIEPLAKLDFYWTPEEQIEETRQTHEQLVAHGFARHWIEAFQAAGYFPDISARTVHSIGIFSGPSESKYNDDVYPDRSWKVLKELHFHELATHALHRNAAGIDLYQSPMCQEEHLRWLAKLCRHYCIEGRAHRLTDDRYELDHIRNPDFERGTQDWTIEPATPGSVFKRHLKGYGLKVQGRHGKAGDHLLCMKRKADKPNVIRQPIKNLRPGRHYSVTLYTGDRDSPHVWQQHTIGLFVRGAIVERPRQTIHSAWRHGADPAFGGKDTFSNYHRIVFQAKADTAELVISDWRQARIPTGPVGQELMFNFVQVEPYLMPEQSGGD